MEIFSKMCHNNVDFDMQRMMNKVSQWNKKHFILKQTCSTTCRLNYHTAKCYSVSGVKKPVNESFQKQPTESDVSFVHVSLKTSGEQTETVAKRTIPALLTTVRRRCD
jgi:hypothetical protein